MSTFYVRRAIEKYEELEENKLAKKYEKKHISFTYYTEKHLSKNVKNADLK